jgi:hypothetical protein
VEKARSFYHFYDHEKRLFSEFFTAAHASGDKSYAQSKPPKAGRQYKRENYQHPYYHHRQTYLIWQRTLPAHKNRPPRCFVPVHNMREGLM